MPLNYCPECGHKTRYTEGVEKVYCKQCGWPLEYRYTLETILGDPVTYEIHQAPLNKTKPTERKKHDV